MHYRAVVAALIEIRSGYGISKGTVTEQCNCAGILDCQYWVQLRYKRTLQ